VCDAWTLTACVTSIDSYCDSRYAIHSIAITSNRNAQYKYLSNHTKAELSTVCIYTINKITQKKLLELEYIERSTIDKIGQRADS
jgi:tRNA splicing ligase